MYPYLLMKTIVGDIIGFRIWKGEWARVVVWFTALNLMIYSMLTLTCQTHFILISKSVSNEMGFCLQVKDWNYSQFFLSEKEI